VTLPPAFYDRPVVEVARDLVGCVVEHEGCAGAIVETEAYHFSEPASHAYVGVTGRTAVLHGAPGTAYLYRSYGIHALLNAVCEDEGEGTAVLIRALEPLDGIDIMQRRRRRVSKGRRRPTVPEPAIHDLCRGPGNLTMAMGITLAENRVDLLGDRLWIEDRQIDVGGIVWGPRIGITVGTQRPWRASIAGHKAVSARRG
jgi:DNA-3-methyladenine glycosylase